MNVISFDILIEKALERTQEAIQDRDFEKARTYYGQACYLYSQHPTGNNVIEARKLDLYRSLFER